MVSLEWARVSTNQDKTDKETLFRTSQMKEEPS